MSITPKLAGDTIYRGAAHIIIDKPVTKSDWEYIFAAGEVTVKVNRPKRDINVEGFGKVRSPITDETVSVTFTPSGQQLTTKALAVLYGGILAAKPGSSWFGATSTPLSIHTMSGRILTLTNCKPTTFVPITFGAGVARFGGSVTFTGILGRGMSRTDSNALWTPWAAEAFDAEPADTDYPSHPCSASWASIESLALESIDGWSLAVKAELTPFATSNIGTIDYYVPADIGFEISGKPANLSESNLWADYVLGASRQIGTSVTGGLFTVAEDYGGLTATLNNAELIDPANSFSIANPVAGDCVWAARRVAADNTFSPSGTLTLTLNPEA